MLQSLNNTRHQVITGVALFTDNHDPVLLHEITQIQFGNNSYDLLQHYVDSGEPLDKAGAYGIQGKGRLLVKGIEGCYYNAVGLPIYRVYHALKSLSKI